MLHRFSHSVKKYCSLSLLLFLLASCSSIRHTRLSVPVTELRQVEKLASRHPPYGGTLKAKGTKELRVESVTGLRLIRKNWERVQVPIPFTVEGTSDTLILKGDKTVTQLQLEDVDYLEVDAKVEGPWRPTDYLAVVAVTIGVMFCLATVAILGSDD